MNDRYVIVVTRFGAVDAVLGPWCLATTERVRAQLHFPVPDDGHGYRHEVHPVIPLRKLRPIIH